MTEPITKRRKTATSLGSRVTDPRFVNIQSDPRYRLPGKKQKVKLDKRFARALRDDDFTRRAKIDRYGRPLADDAASRRLKHKFEVDQQESESDEPDNDNEVQRELNRFNNRHDLLREGRDVSSSDSESSSDEDSQVDTQEENEEAELAPQTTDVPMGEASSRIAVVNLDWDNIRAEDLMAVFQSFLPATGRLLKVAVYPSEFGKERMQREELEGPPREIFALKNKRDTDMNSDSEEEDDENIKASIIKPDDGTEFDSQALRQYQLERLRYFYAVLTFSSSSTAKAIYDACDGAEYLSTANFFDLRFITDDTDFSEDVPREDCEKLSPGYKPTEFVTDALQHSKVKLTWDAEDGSRKEAAARAFKGGRKEIDENDLKAYLGSDSDEEPESDQERKQDLDLAVPEGLSKKETERQKMRALLGLAPQPAKSSRKAKDDTTGGIQITFSSGLGREDNIEKKQSVFENSPEPEETTVEKYVRKEKERKAKRKEKVKATRIGDVDPEITEAASANDAAGQEKLSEDLGFDDPFFHDSINTEGADKSTSKQRKEERTKKRKQREAEEATSAKQRAELELLMGSDQEDNGSLRKAEKSAKGRTVKHFNMTEIEKAEKAERTGKKGKRRGKNSRNTIVNDDFDMTTDDPRFSKLFESHEFAIDPSNPRFKQTKGMKALLEEGRRRKGGGHDPKLFENWSEKEVTKGNERKGTEKSEVKSLVEKIKRRAK